MGGQFHPEKTGHFDLNIQQKVDKDKIRGDWQIKMQEKFRTKEPLASIQLITRLITNGKMDEGEANFKLHELIQLEVANAYKQGKTDARKRERRLCE